METLATRGPDDENDPTGLRAAAAAMTKLAETLDRVDRRSKSQTGLMGLLVIVASLLVVVAFGNRAITATIEDCINPAGHCYQESRARTADVQRAVIEAQREDLNRNLRVVCSIVEQHPDMDMPPECRITVTPTTR